MVKTRYPKKNEVKWFRPFCYENFFVKDVVID